MVTESKTSLTLVTPEADAEIMSFYQEGMKLMEFAKARVINSNGDLAPATEDLSIIAQVKKTMEQRRKDYLSPFQSHVKETNEAYKKLMFPLEEADRITRSKILTFKQDQDKRRLEAERIEREKLELARQEAALKGGEITVDLTPIEKPEAVPDRVRTGLGTAGTMKIRKYRVVDFAKLPDEYKIENSTLLNNLTKAGIPEIPGIEFYYEETLRVNTRNKGGDYAN